MHFNNDCVLVRRLSDQEFWRILEHPDSSNQYTSHKPVMWFPLNWLTVPIAAYKRKLKEMQAEHFDE